MTQCRYAHRYLHFRGLCRPLRRRELVLPKCWHLSTNYKMLHSSDQMFFFISSLKYNLYLTHVRLQVFTGWLWRMSSSGMRHHVVLVITKVLEEQYFFATCYSHYLLPTCSRFVDCFSPEDGHDTFFWNLSPYKNHVATHPRRWHSLCVVHLK
jgi:hypothetical protein